MKIQFTPSCYFEDGQLHDQHGAHGPDDIIQPCPGWMPKPARNHLLRLVSLRNKPLTRDETNALDAFSGSPAAIIGRKGGCVRSETKARAARENGKRGGRPVKRKS